MNAVQGNWRETLCGRDTSVPATDTKVAWQNTPCPGATNTCPPRFLHLAAKPTESRFFNQHWCGSCESSNDFLLLQWPSHNEVSQPLASRANARPQWLSPSHFVSHLKVSLISNGPAVSGNWWLATEWLLRHRQGPNLYDKPFHITNTPCIHFGHCCSLCVRHHNSVTLVTQRQGSASASGRERHFWDTVAVTQLLSVSSEGFHKIQWPGSSRIKAALL